MALVRSPTVPPTTPSSEPLPTQVFCVRFSSYVATTPMRSCARMLCSAWYCARLCLSALSRSRSSRRVRRWNASATSAQPITIASTRMASGAFSAHGNASAGTI